MDVDPRSQEPLDPYRSPPPLDEKPKPRGAWAAIVAGIGAVLLKLKPLLLVFKGLKFGKLFLTSFSMLAMIWFEAMRYGWAYGVGFVLLIFIHEMGHGYAIKKSGMSAGWPVFIPFFGAMITMNGRPQRATTEAYIAYAGPIAGTGASLVVAALGLHFESRLLLSLAFTGFFLNLFNLVPVVPLDGGRISLVFTRKAWIVGGIALVALFLVSHSPQLILIGVFALMNILRGNHVHEIQATPKERIEWAVRYFGLIAFLAASMYFTQRLLHPDGV